MGALLPINTLQAVYWQTNNSVTGGQQMRGLPGVPIVQQTAEFVVSAAQLLALHGSPLQMLPAPPKGFSIVPVSYAMILEWEGHAYTITGNDGDIYIGWGNTLVKVQAATAIQQGTQGLLDAAASAIAVQPANVSPAIPLALCDGQPLTLAILDQLSAGNGLLHILLVYTIIASVVAVPMKAEG